MRNHRQHEPCAPDWWLRLMAEIDANAREENERIERWLIEDDPERPAKLARLNADPDEIARKQAFQKRVDELVADGVDLQQAYICAASNPDFGLWKASIHLDRYRIATEPIINTPERLQWWMEKNINRILNGPLAVAFRKSARQFCKQTNKPYIVADEYRDEIELLRKANKYAIVIWQANPSLPDVPLRQPDDPHGWYDDLWDWCVKADRAMKAAPANPSEQAAALALASQPHSITIGAVINELARSMTKPEVSHIVKPIMDAPARARQKLSGPEKMAKAVEFYAMNPTATKEQVELAAGYGRAYLSRPKNARRWEAIKVSAGARRRGFNTYNADNQRDGVDGIIDADDLGQVD